MEDEHVSDTDGATRRSVIKRIGVGAAAVWSAPALLSMGGAAFAASAIPCSNCNKSYGDAPTGCAGMGGACSDGRNGYCDTTVEGPCSCDVAAYILGSRGCTSSAVCAATYGNGVVCIHANTLGTTVCIAQCGASFAAQHAVENGRSN